MYKRQYQLELLVEVEDVDEEEGAGEGDLCGGSCTRSLLNNKFRWRVIIWGFDTVHWGNGRESKQQHAIFALTLSRD